MNKYNVHVHARYEILEILGAGSFGTVRKCQNKTTGEYFACKSIAKENVTNVQTLQREIEILKTVRHPHIIRLHDVYEDNSYIHLVTELCTGGELYDRVIEKAEQTEEGHFSEQDASKLIRDILDAIRYCHDEKHIVHRDLKPENFLLQERYGENAMTVKIIDFGLSRWDTDAPFGIMSTRVGTPYYVAPEVLTDSYNYKCDIWSIGIITYILLCGFAPFAGDDDLETLRLVETAKLEFPSPEWDDISPQARHFVSMLLHREAFQRPTAAEALQHPWITMFDPIPIDYGINDDDVANNNQQQTQQEEVAIPPPKAFGVPVPNNNNNSSNNNNNAPESPNDNNHAANTTSTNQNNNATNNTTISSMNTTTSSMSSITHYEHGMSHGTATNHSSIGSFSHMSGSYMSNSAAGAGVPGAAAAAAATASAGRYTSGTSMSTTETSSELLSMDSERRSAFQKFLVQLKIDKTLKNISNVLTPSEAQSLGDIFWNIVHTKKQRQKGGGGGGRRQGGGGSVNGSSSIDEDIHDNDHDDHIHRPATIDVQDIDQAILQHEAKQGASSDYEIDADSESIITKESGGRQIDGDDGGIDDDRVIFSQSLRRTLMDVRAKMANYPRLSLDVRPFIAFADQQQKQQQHKQRQKNNS